VHIITLRQPAKLPFRKSTGDVVKELKAGVPYLISDSHLWLMTQDRAASAIWKVSDARGRFPQYHQQARKLLIIPAGGGYGDQILTWPVAQSLWNCNHYVDVLVEPGNEPCWQGFSWIRDIKTMPCQLAEIENYDAVVNFENVYNRDEHPDQDHPVDRMMRLVNRAPDVRVTPPPLTNSEKSDLYDSFNVSPIALYQLSASSCVRSLTANHSAQLLLKLVEHFSDWYWVALYDPFMPDNYCDTAFKLLKKLGERVILFYTPDIRKIWGLASKSKVVVAPDSMMVHVAGSMEVPCVGLWGPMDPDTRVRYYKRHVPIYHRNACAEAPCFSYHEFWPPCCPVRTVNSQAERSCLCLKEIRAEEVIAAINKAVT